MYMYVRGTSTRDICTYTATYIQLHIYTPISHNIICTSTTSVMKTSVMSAYGLLGRLDFLQQIALRRLHTYIYK